MKNLSMKLIPFLALLSVCAVAQTPKPAVTVKPAPASAGAPLPAAKSKTVLPPGPGRELVIARCQTCHEPNVLETHPHTDDEWGSVIQTMIQRGAKANDDEADLMQDYLAKNFPKKDAASAKKG